MTDTTIKVPGLSLADRYDIEERAGADADALVFERVEVPEGHAGEPVTLALLVAGPFALRAFIAHCIWKDRAAQRPNERFTHTVETAQPDGTTRTEVWSYEVGPGEPPSEAVIRGLTEVPGLEKLVSALSEP